MFASFHTGNLVDSSAFALFLGSSLCSDAAAQVLHFAARSCWNVLVFLLWMMVLGWVFCVMMSRVEYCLWNMEIVLSRSTPSLSD